jgi:hypothetical protein
MNISCSRLGGIVCVLALVGLAEVNAGELIVELSNADDVTFVGAIDRWGADGNPRRAVDPKAKIEAPDVDAIAEKSGPGTWTFTQLAPGRYDLVILARDRKRIEGFGYPPVQEFDPFISHADKAPEAACDFITKDIAKSRLYENKVTPLFFAGDDKTVRVFVQLLRDQPTSFDAEFGEPVATLRHEVWQYTNRFGVWSKEKRTRVFDRILTGKQELRRWSWVWEPALSQIGVAADPITLRYTLPKQFVADEHRGLLPY